MEKRKDKLLWLQVINRAARSGGDKGIESFRMKEAAEIFAADLLTYRKTSK